MSAQSRSARPSAALRRTEQRLRLALAVREWANPYELLHAMGIRRDLRAAVARLAPEVRTSVEQNPGGWYLTESARRAALAICGDAALRQELAARRLPSDDRDPILRALQALHLGGGGELGAMSDLDLRALSNVADWGPAKSADGPALRDRAATQLRNRQRDADRRRMTREPMVARAPVLEKLLAFVRATGAARLLYLHGVGGAGKSTVLAHLEERLEAGAHAVAVVHLDLDRAEIDPADFVALDVELLRQLALVRPEHAPRFRDLMGQLSAMKKGSRVEGRAAMRGGRSALLKQESLRDIYKSDRYSLLAGCLENLSAPTLLVVVDTCEIASARGVDVVAELAEWLGSLTDVLQVPDVAVILAARDPPKGLEGDLLQAVQAAFQMAATVVELGNLSADDASGLLTRLGVPAPLAESAAQVLPGNPLFLRLAAQIYANAPEELAAVRQAHAEGRVDAATARTYLVERVVKHLPEPLARPYVLAAMQLPRVDRRLVAEVVVPAVETDATGAAAAGLVVPTHKAIYEGLKRVRWLAQAAPSGRSFVWRPELRQLALRLVDSDPAARATAERLRGLAIAYHERRTGPEHRAFALYHQLRAGDRPNLPKAQRAQAARRLAPFLDDLPDDARALLLRDVQAPMLARQSLSNPEWQVWLEGAGGRDGQGARLVKAGRPHEALALYRGRPSRPFGEPPTFVIQALADSGDWLTDEIDVEQILFEIATMLDSPRRLPGSLLSRLYWVTRYALLRDGARLTPHHREVLRAHLPRVQVNAALSMVSLLAVAEAEARSDGPLLVPDTWLDSRGSIESITRLYLVRARMETREFALRTHLDNLIVAQHDWVESAAALLHHEREDSMRWEVARRDLERLNGAPFAAVNRMLREHRAPVFVHVSPDTASHSWLILRGQLTELHRPLTHSLRGAWRTADPGLRQGISVAVERTISGMSIRPREMIEWPTLLERNPDAFFPAFVAYADRCRMLPAMALRLTSPADQVAHVLHSLVAWERALGAQGSPYDTLWRPV